MYHLISQAFEDVRQHNERDHTRADALDVRSVASVPLGKLCRECGEWRSDHGMRPLAVAPFVLPRPWKKIGRGGENDDSHTPCVFIGVAVDWSLAVARRLLSQTARIYCCSVEYIHGGGSMLVLSRRKDECIVINDQIRVVVVHVGNTVRIGIEAPEEVSIKRSELLERTVISNDLTVNEP
jgi:carbon storage regulator